MDAPKLTYNPNNLSTWRRQFSTYAMTKYGDAGATLEIGDKPSYITNEFQLPESSPKHKDLEFEVLKAKFISHNTRVERFNESVTRLFGDIQLHLSEASIAQIQSHTDDYTDVMASRCPLLLWRLVIKSHTFAGKEASFVEKEKAKTKLQQTKQGSLSLTEHHSRFDRQLQICKDMQIDLDSKWVIYIYLLTLNVSSFGHVVTTMITEMDTEDLRMPSVE